MTRAQQPAPADTGSPASSSRRALRGAAAVALGLVLLRGAVWVWFAPSSFDGDEAITGLMARHLVTGRAFPLFFYGQEYLLAVEAWLAAPFVAVFGSTAYTMRGVILAMNLLVGWLLVRELIVTSRLSPASAVAAAGFVLVPTARTSALLGQAVGMNIEPFLAALVLWRLRARPAWFGGVLALAFLNREFAAYAGVAVVALALADGRLFRRESLKPALAAALSFAVVWDVVRVARPFSNWLGPGTRLGDSVVASSNVARVAGFAHPAAATVPADLWAMASRFLPDLFGARQEVFAPLAAVNNWQAQGWNWWVLVVVLAAALVPAVHRLARQRTLLSEDRVRFPLYLVLVAAQSAIVCAVARGGGMSPMYQRYILLALFGPVGLVAFIAVVERRGLVRRLAVGAAAAWAIVAVIDSTRFLSVCVTHPPSAPRLELARALTARGVKYAEANYWTAYPVSFLSGERVRVASSDVSRVEEYRRLFSGHRDEAVIIERSRCDGCTPVAGAWIRKAE
jgi:hypothetical protein